MTERFRPVFPDQHHLHSRSESDQSGQSVDLVANLSESTPKLHEFLPVSSQVPVPFTIWRLEGPWYFNRAAPQADDLRLKGAGVQAIYGPGGEITDTGVHTGCRVTRIHPDDEIDVHHTAKVQNAFNGDTDQSLFTDWASTETKEVESFSHRRTYHWHRRPLIYYQNLPDTVNKPVADQAFVIQSTDWGIIETCAYLAPSPENKRSQIIATKIADHIMQQISKHTISKVQIQMQSGFSTTQETPKEYNGGE